MSIFDRYSNTEYVEALRVFLNESKRNFMRNNGFTEARTAETGKGRLPKYEEGPMLALEAKVNDKAKRAEAADSTFGERLQIARDYAGSSDTLIAKQIGVSREMVRRWCSDLNSTNRTEELAQMLAVPHDWLRYGGEAYLPANSHIGTRVGAEAKEYREQLYAMTQSLLASIDEEANQVYQQSLEDQGYNPELADEQATAGIVDGELAKVSIAEKAREAFIQASIEWSVFNTPEIAQVARKAAGRWQVLSNSLLFAPWVPLKARGLVRRYWSDDVERIVQEELAAQPTVFGAWSAIADRCKAMGLSDDEYPKKITLHKRIEKEKMIADQFGVDLNEVVANAVQQFTPAASEEVVEEFQEEPAA